MISRSPQPEHFDVLIVGAGLSGIGAGCRLQTSLPEKTYAILEARDATGGTWDLFRYPGIRSDSDMYTLGYPFRPWESDQAIVDGADILDYIRDTAREYGVDRRIRFHRRVTVADWSSAEQTWTVTVQHADTGESEAITCSFLLMCAGYYRYDQGYTPEFANLERFRGRIVHPQFWPQDLDWAGKRVIVIGSGATAVTLVPELAQRAAHVTMLQRSPSYVLSLSSEDPLAKKARRLFSPRRAYALIRWKNALLMTLTFQLARRRPELAKKLIRRGVERLLPEGYDIETHFTPRYNPWEQRLCIVRNGDLFDAIASDRASIVTDQIETFTETGVRLASGAELEADVVITATGLNLEMLGGSKLSLDGEPVNVGSTMIYRGCMLSDVPNLAFVFGYTNASWTLKSDLTCRYLLRLISHMDEHAYAVCTPRDRDRAVSRQPFVDFSSGYIVRSLEQLPRQGSKPPWRLHQNYLLDLASLKAIPVDEPAMEFSRGPATAAHAPSAPSALAAAA